MAPQRKLQIFVSSTFTDLRRERQAAVAAILENGHIPAGMELFAAGDEEQMRVIRRWIDDSDLFLLILGGRYGTCEPKSGKSYTHLEYEYAIDHGKPFFAIVMSDASRDGRIRGGESVASLTEMGAPDKLATFRAMVTSKLCKFADDEKDIKLGVWQSIRDIEQRVELGGWVSARSLPDTSKVLADVAASAKHAADLDEKNRKLLATISSLREDLIRRRDFGGSTFDELMTALLREQVTLKASAGGTTTTTDLAGALNMFAPSLAHSVSNSAMADKSEVEVFYRVASPLMVFGLTMHAKVPPKAAWQRLVLSDLGQRFVTELRVRLARPQNDASSGESASQDRGSVDQGTITPAAIPNSAKDEPDTSRGTKRRGRRSRNASA